MPIKNVLLICLFASTSYGESVAPFKGYLDIPWGSTEAQVKQMASGTLAEEKTVDAYALNTSKDAAYAAFTLAPPARKLVYTNKHGETVSYYLCRDKLCMVDTKPSNPAAFNPNRLVNEIEKHYGDQAKLVKRKDVAPPYLLVPFDPKTEFLLTAEWDHADGLVRAAIKTWPREDMRQVYRVFYTSKPLMQANKQRLVEIVREKEEAIKRAQEEARRAAEAKKAAEAEKAATGP